MNGDNMNENEKINNGEVAPVEVAPAAPVSATPVPPVEVATASTQEPAGNSNEVKIVTNSNSPTNIDDIKIDTVTIDANQKITAKEYVEEEKYKISGTASEEDLKAVDTKPVEDEVIDEHAIKREVQMSDAEFKKKLIYIIVFVGVIILFMLFMPIIFKIINL